MDGGTPPPAQSEMPPSPPSSALRASPESCNSSYDKTSPPITPRRTTDPMPSALSPHLPLSASNISRPRNRSPFSRSHLRSRSSLSLTPPAMVRAHSMPVVDTGGRIIMPTAVRPSSPLGPPGSSRAPSRRFRDDTFPSSSGGYKSGLADTGGRPIENGNLDRSPKNEFSLNAHNGAAFPGNSFQLRRRPVSPLRQLSQAPSFGGFSVPTWSNSSPLSSHAKYNEPHPLSSNYPGSFSSGSSIPSTPTSCRSRSPSISSLETIEDTPDAEEAALEAERVAKLRAAADAVDAATNGSTSDDNNPPRSNSLDVPGSGGRAGVIGSGPGFGLRDKRKRWSVCGAERRGDLDLETIWED
ncbi:hypothetical protein GP486_001263 [Trichoglossum hirsutum]|uniref:Basic proline-rich protein n=1 Tax=Trichoglossum hirsutum TaxID=265104 RepID=A0A9P8LGC2_9PEZI|nr:hypothetical protein GP486_001263 [Trichoglossum hirsutum]